MYGINEADFYSMLSVASFVVLIWSAGCITRPPDGPTPTPTGAERFCYCVAENSTLETHLQPEFIKDASVTNAAYSRWPSEAEECPWAYRIQNKTFTCKEYSVVRIK